jgi:hypothetical protein
MMKTPIPHAIGHTFDSELLCANRSLARPEVVCGVSWNYHRDNPEPCRYPDLTKRHVRKALLEWILAQRV